MFIKKSESLKDFINEKGFGRSADDGQVVETLF